MRRLSQAPGQCVTLSFRLLSLNGQVGCSILNSVCDSTNSRAASIGLSDRQDSTPLGTSFKSNICQAHPNYAPGRNYDISPDGQRFLMIKEGAPVDTNDPFAGLTRIHVVLNWTEELKRLVPTYPAQ